MASLGRPKLFGPQELKQLRQVVRDRPSATLKELCQAWQQHAGRSVSEPTLQRALLESGLRRLKRPVAQIYQQPPQQPRRYGYKRAHRATSSEAARLTDAEWALAQDLFTPPPGRAGRPALHDRRAMVDACCYVLRTGCSWRMLPTGCFPPWPAVHKAFSRWAAAGKFEQLQDRLRQQWRERIERNEQPSVAVIDSQSTRSSPQGGVKGYDPGKKVRGRKRHIVVDSLGLLLAVVVTSASIQDREAAHQALAQAQQRTGHSIQTLYADSAYAGRTALRLGREQGVDVQVVRRIPRWRWDSAQAPLWPEQTRMQVLPKRWVVERTHAWLERHRRLTFHHDRSADVSRAWVWLAQARMLMARLVAAD